MRTGKAIFWTGFILTVGIVFAYLVLMFIGIPSSFANWLSTLIFCGIVLVGAIMMVLGRYIERTSSSDLP